jgi:hypothetical protein
MLVAVPPLARPPMPPLPPAGVSGKVVMTVVSSPPHAATNSVASPTAPNNEMILIMNEVSPWDPRCDARGPVSRTSPDVDRACILTGFTLTVPCAAPRGKIAAPVAIATNVGGRSARRGNCPPLLASGCACAVSPDAAEATDPEHPADLGFSD